MSIEFSLGSPLGALLCTAFGGLVIYLSWRYSRVARKTSGWTPVPATILRARAREKGDEYEPDIAYRYAIEGKEYESSQVSIFFFYATSLEGARRKAHKYFATQQVVAYVDPADHSQAVLIPGAQPYEALALCILGLLFLAAGVYGAFSYMTCSAG
jgi:Protein of unknown function (DUF3592)